MMKKQVLVGVGILTLVAVMIIMKDPRGKKNAPEWEDPTIYQINFL